MLKLSKKTILVDFHCAVCLAAVDDTGKLLICCSEEDLGEVVLVLFTRAAYSQMYAAEITKGQSGPGEKRKLKKKNC